jgi:hypothetical protein
MTLIWMDDCDESSSVSVIRTDNKSSVSVGNNTYLKTIYWIYWEMTGYVIGNYANVNNTECSLDILVHYSL